MKASIPCLAVGQLKMGNAIGRMRTRAAHIAFLLDKWPNVVAQQQRRYPRLVFCIFLVKHLRKAIGLNLIYIDTAKMGEYGRETADFMGFDLVVTNGIIVSTVLCT